MTLDEYELQVREAHLKASLARREALVLAQRAGGMATRKRGSGAEGPSKSDVLEEAKMLRSIAVGHEARARSLELFARLRFDR